MKNKPVSDFYDKVGLPLVEESNGVKTYIISIGDYVGKQIDYISIK